MIQFEHVSKSYGKTPVLKDLNFTIPDGQFVVLIGPSGCGKTTTMKMINRLLEPDSGTIRIDGQDIHSQDKVELRRHIGYVIQQIGLFPNMTVAQNICVVPKLLKYDKARCDEIVQEMLQLVHMEQSANKYPSELSGGQQQRIGVLRALAASPPIVLMDEPFSALDPLTRESLQDEVKNLQQKLNKTIVFVSHDMSEALKLADIIIFMAAGEIVQMASPEEMLEHPANDLVRTFMGKHTPDTAPSKVESFMRTNVFSVRKDRGVLECAERMARGSVDTLLVTDEQNRYLGTISIGDIQAFIQYLRSFTQPITQLAQISNVLQSLAAAAERIFAFLDLPEVPKEASAVDPAALSTDVEFDGVRFGYTPDAPVIRNFSATVAAGRTVAIVGPTGAGKTTMVKLLMRFYDVDAGAIRIGGADIRELSRPDVRNLFAMVLQDTWLFSGTVRENIRYGRLNATDGDVEAAAREACADHFIRMLPGGYDFEINEDASNLSQGQRQLITIARALLADRRMLILDEATSSVDTRTELRIQEAMDRLMAGRTSFVIAHRLSTIRAADLILVMRDGDIVEQGSHEELLAAGGFYAELYNSQFASCNDRFEE